MTTEIEVNESEATPAASTEAAAATALAEVAVAAIEESASRVDELAQTRAELTRAYEALASLRVEIDERFSSLEARVADANFVALTAVETAEAIAEEVEEVADEIEDEIEDELEEIEDDETTVIIAGEEVADVTAAEAVEAPVIRSDVLDTTTPAGKKSRWVRI